MDNVLSDRIAKSKEIINQLDNQLAVDDAVIAFIVYGSYSDQSDHSPTKYSDVDLEIVVKDELYADYLTSFRPWFEEKIEPVLIETSVSHLQKIFVTPDFVNLEFHISPYSDFDHIAKRELNYFPNGYTLLFDKSGLLNQKIIDSIKPINTLLTQEKFDELNNSFWFFVQSTAPFITRGEYWFAAIGYWVWLYPRLCTLLRYYSNKHVSYNPLKHIENALSPDLIVEIQPLRNLETTDNLKKGLSLLCHTYSKYARKTAQDNSLVYDPSIGVKVADYISQYLQS